MASGVIEIVNRALSRLGAGSIMSFDDNVKEARISKICWDISRQAVIRMHPWNFATKRVVMSPSTTTPAFEFAYSYNLPGDCLRVLDLYDTVSDWKIEGRNLLSDESEINLKYLADIQDPSLYDAGFTDCLSAYLAWDICQNMTQDENQKRLLLEDFRLLLRGAKFTDATEDPARLVQSDDWNDSRFFATGHGISNNDT